MLLKYLTQDFFLEFHKSLNNVLNYAFQSKVGNLNMNSMILKHLIQCSYSNVIIFWVGKLEHNEWQ